MGNDAKSSISKVEVPQCVYIVPEGKRQRISLKTIGEGKKWIEKEGNKEKVYYIVKEANLKISHTKMVFGRRPRQNKFHVWHETNFYHPNESTRPL